MIQKLRKISATRGIRGAITGIAIGIAVIVYAALHIGELGILKSVAIFTLGLVWILGMLRLFKYDWKRL